MLFYTRKNPTEAEQLVVDEYGGFNKVEEWLRKFSQVKEVYVLTEGGVPEGIYFTYDREDFTEGGLETVTAKRGQWIATGFHDSFGVWEDADFRGIFVAGADE